MTKLDITDDMVERACTALLGEKYWHFSTEHGRHFWRTEMRRVLAAALGA